MPQDDVSVSASDIATAADRIAGLVVKTPLLRSARLDELTGATVLIKAECLQATGSFKFRGAANRISSLTPAERDRGVIAWSSGNHGLAVATVCQRLGIAATIVMPSDTPAVKTDGIAAAGAETILIDRVQQDRAAIGMQLAQERSLTVVPPFDHPATIAGQGTVGLELLASADEQGLHLDAVAAPLSGGGLVSGIATAMTTSVAPVQTWGVEPEAFDEFGRSLRVGERVSNDPNATSVCDALQTVTPGELPFDICNRLGVRTTAIDDHAVLAAMRWAFTELKLVVEPSGAVALAALMAGAFDISGRTIGVVLSGGNVDPELFSRAIAQATS